MKISSATVGGDTETEVEVRECADKIEIRMVTPRQDARRVHVLVDGQEVATQ